MTAYASMSVIQTVVAVHLLRKRNVTQFWDHELLCRKKVVLYWVFTSRKGS